MTSHPRRSRPPSLPQPFADSTGGPRSIVVHLSPPATASPSSPASRSPTTPRSAVARSSLHLGERLGVQALSPPARGFSFGESVSPGSATGLFPVLAYDHRHTSTEEQGTRPHSLGSHKAESGSVAIGPGQG